jgi:hypothetical protein
MHSKLNKISELEKILTDNNTTDRGILHFFFQFSITKILKPFENAKKKGFDVCTLILTLCLYRLRGASIWAMQELGNKIIFAGDENTLYRFMNNSRMDWRKLLMSCAKQFKAQTEKHGSDNESIKCFVIDDTDIEKTGHKFEFIGRIFNHVKKTHPWGFKMLTLAYWDGKSLVAADFSLHREKGTKGNFGLKNKEKNEQFSKKRTKEMPAHKRVQELDMKKTQVAISMIKRALKNGFMCSYVLMDSWFVNDYMITQIRTLKNKIIHVLGMCKMDKRKFLIDGKALNSNQIIIKNERKKSKYSKKYKSSYISIVAQYKGVAVKLFYIKYRNAKKWNLLLTTDKSLSFVKAIELYQIRWTIEVLFKECKQYLRLGKSQNTDFDGQIADITLVLFTHLLLSLKLRFEDYETMGELFRQTQQGFLELTLWERIQDVILKIIIELLEFLDIDVEETTERIMRDESAGKKLFSFFASFAESGDNLTFDTKKGNVAA